MIMEFPNLPCRVLRRGAIRVVPWLILTALILPRATADTVALWLFDEQQDLYPSCVLGDAASGDYPLILGPGGRIGPGRFGNALDVTEQPPIELRGKYARHVARAKTARSNRSPGRTPIFPGCSRAVSAISVRNRRLPV